MTPFGYIGIDFGTSNSHFAYCNRDGDLKPQTIALGGKSSVTTCVLWRRPAREEGDVVAFGTEAVETWLQYEAGERAACRFAFGFKPDLAGSEQRGATPGRSCSRRARRSSGRGCRGRSGPAAWPSSSACLPRSATTTCA